MKIYSKRVDWENFSYSLPEVIKINHPIRTRLNCPRKCFRSIEDGPGGWVTKRRILVEIPPYAIVEWTAANKILCVKNILGEAYTFSNTLVKKIQAVNQLIKNQEHQSQLMS